MKILDGYIDMVARRRLFSPLDFVSGTLAGAFNSARGFLAQKRFLREALNGAPEAHRDAIKAQFDDLFSSRVLPEHTGVEDIKPGFEKLFLDLYKLSGLEQESAEVIVTRVLGQALSVSRFEAHGDRDTYCRLQFLVNQTFHSDGFYKGNKEVEARFRKIADLLEKTPHDCDESAADFLRVLDASVVAVRNSAVEVMPELVQYI
ncbi:MAG: hypothetical protein ACRBCT_01040 [Alphaproteobacteria bacterium]